MQNLETIRIPAFGAEPSLRIKLENDAGDLVDMTSGYSDFQAQIARENSAGTSRLDISSGVTGDSEGFVIPADAIAALDPAFVYVITATATRDATGKLRRAQALLVIDAAPAPV